MHVTAYHRRVRRDEEGATLILVLVFTLVASLTVGGLLTAERADLSSSDNFASARSLEYDASTAVNLAIQSIRYTPLIAPGQTLNASPPMPCWTPTGGTYGVTDPSYNVTPDGNDIAVWCSTAWFPTSANTRVVTISACQKGISNAACAQNPVLQSVVTFDDYPAGVGEPAWSYGQCVVYCGTGQTVNSWLLYPTVPAVKGISPSGGSVTAGNTITISGSGFAQNSTVNFVEESGGTPTTDNVVIPVSSTDVSGSEVQATVPSIVEGSTYYVTVSTPEGTSAYGPVYTFSSGTPVVTGWTTTPACSAAGCASTGGTAITISGNNFVVGDTVNFVEESGGTPVSGGAVVGATGVTVSLTGANTVEITALSPPIAIGSTYFVQVSSPNNGTATDTSSVFTYQTVVPTVNLISPTSGNSSTTISIYGTGFQQDAVVTFTSETNGTANATTYNASSVNYTSSVLITAVPPSSLPSGSSSDTYFVTVSTPGITGQSSYFPVFTASS